ncbi:hypothetical protein LINPERPRIM_LOCUS588 [Linum perenne]
MQQLFVSIEDGWRETGRLL